MNFVSAKDRDALLENLAAELTNAAYPVMLKHGMGRKWLEIELDLWTAMIESVKQMKPEILQALSQPCKPPKAPEFFG